MITGVARRRRWSVEEELWIVAESLAGEAPVSVVAQRHGLRSNQLFKWRKLARKGMFGPFPADRAFVPLGVSEDGGALRLSPPALWPRPSAGVYSAIGASLAEIELANGCRLRVSTDIEAAALHRLVTALKAAG